MIILVVLVALLDLPLATYHVFHGAFFTTSHGCASPVPPSTSSLHCPYLHLFICYSTLHPDIPPSAQCNPLYPSWGSKKSICSPEEPCSVITDTSKTLLLLLFPTLYASQVPHQDITHSGTRPFFRSQFHGRLRREGERELEGRREERERERERDREGRREKRRGEGAGGKKRGAGAGGKGRREERER